MQIRLTSSSACTIQPTQHCSSGVEHWAHNPGDLGSKPSNAISFLDFFFFPGHHVQVGLVTSLSGGTDSDASSHQIEHRSLCAFRRYWWEGISDLDMQRARILVIVIGGRRYLVSSSRKPSLVSRMSGQPGHTHVAPPLFNSPGFFKLTGIAHICRIANWGM